MEEVRGSSPLGPTTEIIMDKNLKNTMPDVKIAISTIADGNMSFLSGKKLEVIAARKLFCQKNGIEPSECVEMHQVHGSEVVKIDSSTDETNLLSDNNDLVCDGLTTSSLGLGIVVKVADCMPVVIYDKTNKALSAVHAGRKGVELNILASALNTMAKTYGSKSEDLAVFVGPAISAESYIFDSNEGVNLEFWQEYFKLGNDEKYHMDIKGRLLSQALELGIPKSNIIISDIDTFTDKNYFSHRRSMATGEKEGRFVLLAYIVNN